MEIFSEENDILEREKSVRGFVVRLARQKAADMTEEEQKILTDALSLLLDRFDEGKGRSS